MKADETKPFVVRCRADAIHCDAIYFKVCWKSFSNFNTNVEQTKLKTFRQLKVGYRGCGKDNNAEHKFMS